MKRRRGKNALMAEVSNISKFGVWICLNGKEYFMDYDGHPWFKDARVEDVLEVEAVTEQHIRWPRLDVDIHTDSLDYPERYPLIAKR
jgi:hypothetical protein